MADIRSFLPRTEQTNPESRRLLSRDLVQRTLPHVAPAPPPGTDPEAFLAAVIAERSRRDEQRLRIAQGRRHELSAEVRAVRSEGHTSELQSRGQVVCRLLLEKKEKQS